MKLSSQLAGVAGEYFVAAELSRRGFIASITMRNTRGIDILATNSAAKRAVTIQCKSSRDRNKSWILSDKAEHFTSKNHYYVFVKLGAATECPAHQIVLSKNVASELKDVVELNCESEDYVVINYSAISHLALS